MAEKNTQREWCIRATRYSRVTPTYTSIQDFHQNVTAPTEEAAIRKFRRMRGHGKRTVSINSCRAYTADPFDVIHLFDDGTGEMRAE